MAKKQTEMRSDRDMVQDLLDELVDISDGMSEWECDFVDSVDQQYRKEGWISDKQLAKATEIAERHDPPED